MNGEAVSVTAEETDLTQQIYRQLRRDLVRGRYHAGSALYETKVASDYGGSRTPAREALLLLVDGGFLEKLPKGYRVRQATPEDIVALYEVRTTLEISAAVTAAYQRTELDVARMRFAQEHLTQTDPDDQDRATEVFHQALWAASHNPHLVHILQNLADRIQLFEGVLLKGRSNIERTAHEHEAVLDAVVHRDAEEAERLVAEHLGRTRSLRLAEFSALIGFDDE